MKVGVFGGTFDPIHLAHLVVAEEVGARLGLAEVRFVPAGRPWLKVDHSVLAAEHRVQMVRLAIAGNPRFKLSTAEVERAGPSYTVDTIADLRRELDVDSDIYFILGWDSLSDLPHWHEPSRLVELCYLVAVPRPGYPKPRLQNLEGRIPGLSERLVMIDNPKLDISSSEIRQRVAQGLPIHGLVPEPVERYIHEHRLYQG